MQKDTVIHVIRSVTLDPAGHNVPYVIDNITETAVNVRSSDWADIWISGLIDTMQDLIVNFIGAFICIPLLVSSMLRTRGKGLGCANRFIRGERRKTGISSRLPEKSRRTEMT